MANSIKVDGKTITYTKVAVTENTVTFSDGTVVKMTGSVANSAVLAAYKAAKAAHVPPVVTNPVKTLLMGNADLKDLHDLQNVIIMLKPGIYTERCDFKNLKDVTIDGQNGVVFSTGQRAIQMNGNVSGLILKNIAFKDISDYVIDFWGSGQTKYVPSDPKSYVDGLTLINLTASNTGTLLHIDGGVINGSQYGLVKNLIIQGCKFQDSKEPGNAYYIGNGMNYDISGNTVNNINYYSSVASAPNGVHNAVFQLNGNGKFYSNTITNHEGNAVRAWLHTQDPENGTRTVEIYNNLVWNSLKYGAFEAQVTPDMKANGAKAANASIHDNIAGKLNTRKDWEGQMLDLYEIMGTLSYYGNVGFDMVKVQGAISDMINAQFGVTVIRNDGNKYFATQALAMSAVPTLKASLSGVV